MTTAPILTSLFLALHPIATGLLLGFCLVGIGVVVG